MRLTILNQFYAPDISPTAQLAASLAEHRAERGDDVTIVTGRAGYLEGLSRSARPEAHPGLRVRRVWTPDLGKSSRTRRILGYASFSLGCLVRMIRLPRQDVVISMTTPPFLVLAAVLHQLLHPRARIMLWSMDCYPDAAERFGELEPGGLVSRLLHTLNRRAFRRVETVIGLDGAMVELLERYADGPDRPRFEVIPNWERLAQFPATTPEAWAGYAGLGRHGRTVVLYLGNTGVGHRFDTVLDAAAVLGDEALFLFMGGGARWGQLQDEVRARRLTNVAFHAYVPKEDTPAVMAGADIALITLDERSLGVMSPSKLHANLAAGLPVLYIGPEGSNVDEAIDEHGVGRSLRVGDVIGVATAVRDLAKDTATRRRARQAFELAYSDVAVLPRFDRLLER